MDEMITKRPIYNGYEEHYMTGKELRDFFKDAYECSGRHHEQISNCKMNFTGKFKRVKSDITYRVFLNDSFCKILDAETDKNIYFFGYTKNKPQ